MLQSHEQRTIATSTSAANMTWNLIGQGKSRGCHIRSYPTENHHLSQVAVIGYCLTISQDSSNTTKQRFLNREFILQKKLPKYTLSSKIKTIRFTNKVHRLQCKNAKINRLRHHMHQY